MKGWKEMTGEWRSNGQAVLSWTYSRVGPLSRPPNPSLLLSVSFGETLSSGMRAASTLWHARPHITTREQMHVTSSKRTFMRGAVVPLRSRASRLLIERSHAAIATVRLEECTATSIFNFSRMTF